ncbi:release factor glutamine methyltransferase [Micromonospora pallida]|uniref:Release factor glutamine methyltransferase n=1 Tax=Micromonospora pallida TaxID=145854 RepID=A0A1C6S238_9ACTN|nr:methyltransferase [Micromonospora pallida]SCL23468.1 release factor glutamine methyltransferase [Micromonospora pallida]
MDPMTPRTSLLDDLPPPLPAARIVALNQPRADLHTHRRYEWNGWTFEVPPGVFLPGGTSRMVHERLLDGRIPVAGRRYGAMGVGLGVEAVAAAHAGAAEIYAIDVHPASVAAAERHHRQLAAGTQGRLVPLVADLFDNFPAGARLDVVTFNPPAVSQVVSDDPDVVRNVCVGAPLLAAFFRQLVDRRVLAPDGEVFVVASNTADLAAIVGHARDAGLTPTVDHVHDWHDGVLTYLFRIRPGADA